jgi:vancomycin resistance protein YoaR
MKVIILILFFSLFLLTGCNESNRNTTDNSTPYSSERTSIYKNSIIDYTNTSSINETNSITENRMYLNSLIDIGSTELAIYRTTIYTKTPERQNNVKLSCNQLSGVIVASRGDFFFY